MKNDSILCNVFKDKGLFKGLIISLLTHFFLFTIFPIKKDEILGDKYIPIEILDIKSPSTKGESINESEKAITKNLSTLENNFKEESEEKLGGKIDEKKFEDSKNDAKSNKVEKSLLKTSLQKSQLENEQKIRGTENGMISNKIEAGSIKGQGYQKVTCLNCIEPKYPKLAIKRGYEGILKLEVLILKSGIVKEVFIRESTGFEILDKAGVNAALRSKFYPLNKKTNLNIEYTLKLN
tara:strand:- start:118 stop:828 length:711 start_codon:yes stop_codon:yes gene_type:complete